MRRTKKRKHVGYGPGMRYYDTGKVKIGIAYKRPLRQLSQGEERLQRALLSDRPARKLRVCPYTAAIVAGVLSVGTLIIIHIWRAITP